MSVNQSKKQKPTARPARKRSRHWALLAYFVVIVIVPFAFATWYLTNRAQDQYASTIAFTVRNEEASISTDFLGGLGGSLGSASANDTDILYEFIRSQELVAKVDKEVNLHEVYGQHFDVDPIFGLAPGATIEDLSDYWQRVVRVSYDASSGLMELRVLAFTPEDARKVAETIVDLSSAKVNELAATAREDATRYAQQDLDIAIERLKKSREALTSFRIANQIVDPTADIQGQMGLLNTLQAQLAEALIELDLMTASTRQSDPRLDQIRRRVEVIEARIVDERKKFGAGTGGADESYATTIAEFESLAIEQEFAEQTYGLALSAFDTARAEANRKSRYLATYIEPTLAEKSEFPQRPLILGLIALFSSLFWAISTLTFYALRDRR